MPKIRRPDLNDTKGAPKEVRLMHFVRGAVLHFTSHTPMTAEEIAWAFSFLAGATLAHKDSQANTAATVKEMRDYAVAALDDGIDWALERAAGADKIIIPN